MNPYQKEELKRSLVACLAQAPEVSRIVVFGSFLTSDSPHDMDVAVFQESDEPYLQLAMKYRRQARPVARYIPLDIIPIRKTASSSPLLREIETGETIYER